MLCVVLVVCWPIAQPLCLLHRKLVPPSPPSSGKYGVGKYSTDCNSVTVPLVVATRRVAMDTSSRSDDPFPGSTNLKALAPKLIFVDVLKIFKMAANLTCTGDGLLRYLSLMTSI